MGERCEVHALEDGCKWLTCFCKFPLKEAPHHKTGRGQSKELELGERGAGDHLRGRGVDLLWREVSQPKIGRSG